MKKQRVRVTTIDPVSHEVDVPRTGPATITLTAAGGMNKVRILLDDCMLADLGRAVSTVLAKREKHVAELKHELEADFHGREKLL